MYEVERLAIEIASVILYFILVRYMIKPYLLTGEERYLGLPLGFAFLGIAELLLGIGIIFAVSSISTFSVVIRTFAFVFLAITYFFSKNSSKNRRLVWIITLSSLIVGLATLCVFLVSDPLLRSGVSANYGVYLRLLELVFLSYICVHTLSKHIKSPDPTTLFIPLGFILLTVSQYSHLIRAVDTDYMYGVAFVGGLIARFMALGVFLFVAYRAFYGSTKSRGENEKNRS